VLLAHVTSSEARDALQRAAKSDVVVRFCASQDDLAGAVRQADVGMLVWEMGPDAHYRIAQVSTAVRARDRLVPFVARIELASTRARQVLILAEHLPGARISLLGYDDFARDLTESLKGVTDPSAGPVILRRLLPSVAPAVADIFAAATLAGRRRTSVSALADLCGMAIRTLECRIRGASLVPARDLLGWMLSLHSLWELDVLGWRPVEVAFRAGFTCHESWAHYVDHHAGARPRELLRRGGFDGLLELYASRIDSPV
jgi:hypothetical protein